MQELLNEAIIPMLNDGLISMRRAKELIYLKEFIDRVSTRKYIEDKDVDQLFDRFGVLPSVLTWGDYFQTDLASSLMVISDDEFESVMNTVRFDIISSYIIFSEKEYDFFSWVDDTHLKITLQNNTDYSEEEQEILHLKILMDYFQNLGIVDKFTDTEMEWYSSYKEAKAV